MTLPDILLTCRSSGWVAVQNNGSKSIPGKAVAVSLGAFCSADEVLLAGSKP